MNYKDTIGYLRDKNKVYPIKVGNIGKEFDNKTGLLMYLEIDERVRKKYFSVFKNYFNHYKDYYYEFKNRDVINILEKLSKQKHIYLFKNWKNKIEEIFTEIL